MQASICLEAYARRVLLSPSLCACCRDSGRLRSQHFRGDSLQDSQECLVSTYISEAPCCTLVMAANLNCKPVLSSTIDTVFPGAHDPSPPEEVAEAVLSETVSNEAVPEYDESFSSLIYIPCLKPNEYVGTFKGSGRVTMANVSEPAFEKLAKNGPTLLIK